jgi:hypothetical protein
MKFCDVPVTFSYLYLQNIELIPSVSVFSVKEKFVVLNKRMKSFVKVIWNKWLQFKPLFNQLTNVVS